MDFFYDSKCRLNGNVAIVKTHGALLKSAKKAKQLFNSEALGLVDRQDLTTRFEVDSLGLLAEGTYLKLAIRKDCITYSVEVTGVWISEEAVLKSVFEKIDFFNEDNLHGYPRKWP